MDTPEANTQPETEAEARSVKERLIAFLKEDGLTVAIVIILIIAYAILSTAGDTFSSTAELDARLASGTPTVVELYANNCSICLASKPKVDQLERDLAPTAEVLRINVRTDFGKYLAYKWEVTGVPTFFVFDGGGVMLYRRGGAPDVEAITEVVVGIETLSN